MGASSDAIAKPSSHSALTLTLRTQMREKIASRDRVTAQRATRPDERCWENFVACRLLDERWVSGVYDESSVHARVPTPSRQQLIDWPQGGLGASGSNCLARFADDAHRR